MGKLYCVCNEASEANCTACMKYKRIKPDRTINCSTWPREKLWAKQDTPTKKD